jgi:hypothetical protein
MVERVKLKVDRRTSVPQYTTRYLKDAVLLAAEQVGQIRWKKVRVNGRLMRRRVVDGKDKLTGYLRFLAINHPTSFSAMLQKVLPMQVATFTKMQLDVEYRTSDAIRKDLMARGIPVDAIENIVPDLMPVEEQLPPPHINGRGNGHDV